MRRRKNAPISRRDKAALRRILKTHKGRGNRSNPRGKKSQKHFYPKNWSKAGSRYQRAADLAHHHRGSKRKRSKWRTAGERAKRQIMRKHGHGKYARVNPKRGKRSRRYQRGAAQGLGRKHLRKMTAHGRHLDRYGHRSTARSRRRTRR